VSTDQTTWRRVVDKTRIACQGWQTLRWQERVAVTFIRIVGTQNTANEVFHCVHFECPARSVPPARHQKGGQTTAAEMADDQPSTSQLLQQDVVVVPTLEVTAVVTPLRESSEYM
jgi:BTB/POZ domain-containing protein 9